MTALQFIKSLGLEDALEVEIYTAVKERTLYNWYNKYPHRFKCMVLAAATIKKKLKLTTNEVDRKKIEILTRRFLEQGGGVEVVENLEKTIDPKAKPWGQELF